MSKKELEGDKVDYNFRILIIGNTSVGKTSVLIRYADDYFSQIHLATIGIDKKSKILDINNKKIKLTIMDTAGQEKLNSLTTSLYKNADGVFLIYAIDDKASFESITKWYKDIKDFAHQHVEVVLLGNKCDLSTREVTEEEGKELAKNNNLPFFETSAKDTTNINEAFNCIVTNLLKNKSNSTVNEGEKKTFFIAEVKKKKKGCCSKLTL